MNKIPFAEATSFPLDSTTLQSIQDNYNLIGRTLAQFFGTNVIVSGIEESGNMLTDGVIILGGEILVFKQSAKANYFKITETKHETTTTEGKFTVLYERYVTAVSEATAYVRANIQRANFPQKLDKSIYDASHSIYEETIVLNPIQNATYSKAELHYLRVGDIATCTVTITGLTTTSLSFFALFDRQPHPDVVLPRKTGIYQTGVAFKSGTVRPIYSETYANGFRIVLGTAAFNETIVLSFTSIIPQDILEWHKANPVIV